MSHVSCSEIRACTNQLAATALQARGISWGGIDRWHNLGRAQSPPQPLESGLIMVTAAGNCQRGEGLKAGGSREGDCHVNNTSALDINLRRETMGGNYRQRTSTGNSDGNARQQCRQKWYVLMVNANVDNKVDRDARHHCSLSMSATMSIAMFDNKSPRQCQQQCRLMLDVGIRLHQ